MGKGMERGKRKSRGGGEGTREERGVSSCLGTPATCLCGTLESQGIRELHSWAQQSSRWDGRERFRELVPVFGPHPQLSPTHTSTPAHMYTPTYMYTPHIQMHTHTCTHTHTRQLNKKVLEKVSLGRPQSRSHERILASQMPARAQGHSEEGLYPHLPQDSVLQVPVEVQGNLVEQSL
jgi:hypothetical protein